MAKIALMNYSAGLNNNLPPACSNLDQAGRKFLSSCNNIVIGDSGRVERCPGKSIERELAGVHSLYTLPEIGYVYVQDFFVYTSTGETKQLVSNGRMSYARLDDRVFYSNGIDKGYIKQGYFYDWEAGEYNGPVTARVFVAPFPGHILAYGLGRIAVASERSVYLSEPMNPFLFCLSDSRFTYKTKVKLIAGVKNGFWISDSEGIYFLNRQSDGFWKQEQKAYYPALEGEASPVSLIELNLEGLFGEGYLCVTQRGICLLGPDGIFINLTDKVLELKDVEGNYLDVNYFSGIIHGNKYYVTLSGGVKLGLIYNLKTGAVTQQDVYAFNSACCIDASGNCYGAFSDGIYHLFEIWPRVEADFEFYVDTQEAGRLRFLHIHGEFYDDIEVSVTSDKNITETYIGKVLHAMNKTHEFRMSVSRVNDIGTYFKIKVKNINGRYFNIHRIMADFIQRKKNLSK